MGAQQVKEKGKKKKKKKKKKKRGRVVQGCVFLMYPSKGWKQKWSCGCQS